MARAHLALLAALGLLSCCRPPDNPTHNRPGDAQKRLPVTYRKQEDGQLCWAAGVEMVTDYPQAEGRRVLQCRQVTDELAATTGNGRNCCPSANGCNVRAQPRFDRYDYHFKRGKPACHLTWQRAKQEIDANRPFLFDYVYDSNDGAHLEVIVGYQALDDEKTFFAYDPDRGVSIEWFDDYFVTGPYWRHQLDYFEIEHNPQNKGREDVECE